MVIAKFAYSIKAKINVSLKNLTQIFYDTIKGVATYISELNRPGAASRYGQLVCVSFSEEAARDMKGLITPHGLCGDRARRVHDNALLVTFPKFWWLVTFNRQSVFSISLVRYDWWCGEQRDCMISGG